VDSSLRIVRSDEVTLTMTGDEALLVDQRSGSVHVINRTAARLWELCEGEPTETELVDAMASAYQVPADTLRSDVEEMVATFRNLGVIEPRPAS
jgi:PqqD family protein of HPr-rel-A system